MSCLAEDSGQWVKDKKHRTEKGVKQYMKYGQVQVKVRSVISIDLVCVLSLGPKGFKVLNSILLSK